MASEPESTVDGRGVMDSSAPMMGDESAAEETLPEMDPVFWPLRSMMMRALR